MLLTGLIPVLLLLVISYAFTRRSIIDSQRKEAAQIARPVAAELARSLRDVIDDIHICRSKPALAQSRRRRELKADRASSLGGLSRKSQERRRSWAGGLRSPPRPRPPDPAPAEAFEIADRGQFYIRQRQQLLDGERGGAGLGDLRVDASRWRDSQRRIAGSRGSAAGFLGSRRQRAAQPTGPGCSTR